MADAPPSGFTDGEIVAVVLIVVFSIILLILSWKSVWIVRGSEVVLVERFGRYHRTLLPGA